MKGIKIDLKKIGESLKTRQVRYGGYAALITLAVIAGLILINLIMGQFAPQVDLTGNRMFSLSEQTLQVIDSVDSQVVFHGLWRPGEERSEITTALDLYLARNKNFRLNIVDPERNPGLVQRFDKDNKGISPGSVVVEGQKGFKVIGPMEMYDLDYSRATYENPNPSITGVAVERRLTNALLYVAAGTTPAVYELIGHDEAPLGGLGAQALMERENYSLKQLNLLLSDIPADASALILNTPRSDLSPGEADKLLAWLDKGGRLLVLADFRAGELANLNRVFASYGFQFDYGVVIEPDQTHTAGSPLLVLPERGDHDIVKPLNEQESPILLSQGMGVSELSAKRRSIEFIPFLNTSKDSFLRTDISVGSLEKIASDAGGPITMGVAVKDPSYIQGNEPQARIVAISCGALLESVSFYGQIPGNLDLFMNSLTWLEDRPENIAVRSKSLFILPMRLNTLQIVIFGLLFVIVIPLALFAGGLVIWLKRRHL
ncbi:MAG: GldG family protein [Treponema sp.]|jgi:hypothetical protein|nr:GldG family protein [Treponema sp.]